MGRKRVGGGGGGGAVGVCVHPVRLSCHLIRPKSLTQCRRVSTHCNYPIGGIEHQLVSRRLEAEVEKAEE